MEVPANESETGSAVGTATPPIKTDAAGVRRQTTGWEYVHVAIDDATRLAYVEVLCDEKATTAIGFLRRAVAHYASYAITVERLITDNGSAYRSTIHAIACRALAIRHLRTRPYRPQTKRQGRTLHPHPLGRLGIRSDIPLKQRAHRRA
jgi:transposase InsO family protein